MLQTAERQIIPVIVGVPEGQPVGSGLLLTQQETGFPFQIITTIPGEITRLNISITPLFPRPGIEKESLVALTAQRVGDISDSQARGYATTPSTELPWAHDLETMVLRSRDHALKGLELAATAQQELTRALLSIFPNSILYSPDKLDEYVGLNFHPDKDVVVMPVSQFNDCVEAVNKKFVLPFIFSDLFAISMIEELKKLKNNVVTMVGAYTAVRNPTSNTVMGIDDGGAKIAEISIKIRDEQIAFWGAYLHAFLNAMQP